MKILITSVVLLFIFATNLLAAVQWTTGDGSNGHWYEVFRDYSVDWLDSKAAAESTLCSETGTYGYLATITSKEENNFITDVLLGEASELDAFFIGGFQPDGTAEPNVGWQWITGEPWSYTNWNTTMGLKSEPNNGLGTGEEDALEIHWSNDGYNGLWNDVPTSSLPQDGYIVEYEVIPEPATLLLLGLGGLFLRKRRN